MNLGAEPKKVAILGGLVAAAAVVLYLNVFAGGDGQPSTPRPITGAVTAAPKTIPSTRSVPAARRATGKAALGEFRPRMGAATPEERPDPASVDPALHLELLTKLQEVEVKNAGRNLFQYGSALPSPAAKAEPMPTNVPKIPVNVIAPPPPPPGPGTPAAGATATPATFKYYGLKISRASGVKLAFLLDGEDIIVAGENEVVKKRYRVVRILPGSVVVEDMQGSGQQTITIEGLPAG